MKKNYPEKILDAVVAILMEMRQQQGLSQEKLAIKAGLTRPAVSFMESGRNRPSLYVCIKLADAMGMSFSKLAKEAEKRVK